MTDIERCKGFRNLFVTRYFEGKFIENNTEKLLVDKFRREMKEINGGLNRKHREAEIIRSKKAATQLRAPISTVVNTDPILDQVIDSLSTVNVGSYRGKYNNDNNSVGGGSSVVSGMSYSSTVMSNTSNKLRNRPASNDHYHNSQFLASSSSSVLTPISTRGKSSHRTRTHSPPIAYKGEDTLQLSQQLLLPDLGRRSPNSPSLTGPLNPHYFYQQDFNHNYNTGSESEGEESHVTNSSLTFREPRSQAMVDEPKPRSISATISRHNMNPTIQSSSDPFYR
eukprot:CAMPEP_0170121600 /NCGR_PEP_ID=MMETSP0020_2-20130122/16022_1 /TAXON_ID=98059 /ORGANISM="Dinobryon sp., Strain UTEXLB2267" /LENGTH=280 /DNA_ID=CAMNT_0010352061 /DNA_START=489 /DNA_END=1331 /DNA_ORIENTATION=+